MGAAPKSQHPSPFKREQSMSNPLRCHYVEILGPYDCTWLGPFEDRDAAREYELALHENLDPNVFDTRIYSYQAMVALVTEFGPIEITTPGEYNAQA
jgi:hypothetical protein